ncbi:MAG: 3-dehydroquinate synthase II, partial [Halobacteriaceae archaeon]
MPRSIWLKADDSVGDWATRKRRITAGLEAGVDWVLTDEQDIEKIRELGDINIAAFRTNDADVIGEATADHTADTYIVGKDGEGDRTTEIPDDFSGSADLTTLRRDTATEGAYIRITDKKSESFAETAAKEATYTIVIGEDWQIIPLENLIALIGEETNLIAGVQNAEEARTAFETLEIGADGVLL